MPTPHRRKVGHAAPKRRHAHRAPGTLAVAGGLLEVAVVGGARAGDQLRPGANGRVAVTADGGVLYDGEPVGTVVCAQTPTGAAALRVALGPEPLSLQAVERILQGLAFSAAPCAWAEGVRGLEVRCWLAGLPPLQGGVHVHVCPPSIALVHPDWKLHFGTGPASLAPFCMSDAVAQVRCFRYPRYLHTPH